MQQGAEESWSTEVLVTGPPGSRTVVTCKVSLQTQEGGVEEKRAGSHRTRLAASVAHHKDKRTLLCLPPSPTSVNVSVGCGIPPPILAQGGGISASLSSIRLREASSPLRMGFGT